MILEPPFELPPLLVNKSQKGVYHVYRYKNKWNSEKQRSQRVSSKLVGHITGGAKEGLVEFTDDFINEFPQLKDYDVYKKGRKFLFDKKVKDEVSIDVNIDNIKHFGAYYAIKTSLLKSNINKILKEKFAKDNNYLFTIIFYLIMSKDSNIDFATFAKENCPINSYDLSDNYLNTLLESLQDTTIEDFFNSLEESLYSSKDETKEQILQDMIDKVTSLEIDTKEIDDFINDKQPKEQKEQSNEDQEENKHQEDLLSPDLVDKNISTMAEIKDHIDEDNDLEVNTIFPNFSHNSNNNSSSNNVIMSDDVIKKELLNEFVSNDDEFFLTSDIVSSNPTTITKDEVLAIQKNKELEKQNLDPENKVSSLYDVSSEINKSSNENDLFEIPPMPLTNDLEDINNNVDDIMSSLSSDIEEHLSSVDNIEDLLLENNSESDAVKQQNIANNKSDDLFTAQENLEKTSILDEQKIDNSTDLKIDQSLDNISSLDDKDALLNEEKDGIHLSSLTDNSVDTPIDDLFTVNDNVNNLSILDEDKLDVDKTIKEEYLVEETPSKVLADELLSSLEASQEEAKGNLLEPTEEVAEDVSLVEEVPKEESLDELLSTLDSTQEEAKDNLLDAVEEVAPIESLVEESAKEPLSALETEETAEDLFKAEEVAKDNAVVDEAPKEDSVDELLSTLDSTQEETKDNQLDAVEEVAPVESLVEESVKEPLSSLETEEAAEDLFKAEEVVEDNAVVDETPKDELVEEVLPSLDSTQDEAKDNLLDAVEEVTQDEYHIEETPSKVLADELLSALEASQERSNGDLLDTTEKVSQDEHIATDDLLNSNEDEKSETESASNIAIQDISMEDSNSANTDLLESTENVENSSKEDLQNEDLSYLTAENDLTKENTLVSNENVSLENDSLNNSLYIDTNEDNGVDLISNHLDDEIKQIKETEEPENSSIFIPKNNESDEEDLSNNIEKLSNDEHSINILGVDDVNRSSLVINEAISEVEDTNANVPKLDKSNVKYNIYEFRVEPKNLLNINNRYGTRSRLFFAIAVNRETNSIDAMLSYKGRDLNNVVEKFSDMLMVSSENINYILDDVSTWSEVENLCRNSKVNFIVPMYKFSKEEISNTDLINYLESDSCFKKDINKNVLTFTQELDSSNSNFIHKDLIYYYIYDKDSYNTYKELFSDDESLSIAKASYKILSSYEQDYKSVIKLIEDKDFMKEFVNKSFNTLNDVTDNLKNLNAKFFIIYLALSLILFMKDRFVSNELFNKINTKNKSDFKILLDSLLSLNSIYTSDVNGSKQILNKTSVDELIIKIFDLHIFK